MGSHSQHRAKQRHRRTRGVQKWVALQLAYLNFIRLGRPSRPPRQGLFCWEARADFGDVYSRLERDARRFCASSGGEIPSLGRGRARLSRALQLGAQLPYSRVSADAAQSEVAREIEIERIALPTVAGTIRPSDVIKDGACPERAAVAADLRRLELPVDLWPNPTLTQSRPVGPKGSVLGGLR